LSRLIPIKVLTVFGTRPEAIKLAPVIKEMGNYPNRICSLTVSTGQHRQMLDQVLDFFEIEPDFDLKIMAPNQKLSQVVMRSLVKLEEIIGEVSPDLLLIQGDTTTVFAASLAAYYKKVKVGHIEAGLRSGDKYQPFPEEINRRLADVLTDFYFAPTERSRNNLIKEGVDGENIYVTGNTVIDALLKVAERDFEFEHPVLSKIDFESKKVILVTAHRRESFGESLRDICRALRELAERRRDLEIIFPVHLNPHVQNIAKEELFGLDNLHLIKPLDYITFVNLMKRCYFILTDSGGIQEEAPSLDKPILVMRDKTERPEAVDAGAAKLVGTQREAIIREALRLLEDASGYESMARIENPFGDGMASKRIVEVILRKFNGQTGE